MSGLGGTVGYGTDCLPACDDCYWPDTGLDITPAFPSGLHFYDGTYTTTYINNNGNISFLSGLSAFTPDAFPGASQPMIAPFWADVDTRDSSCTTGVGGGTTCGNPTSDGVWWSMAPGQFVVTWDHVGYFACHPTPSMSFQLILTSTGCTGSSADGGSTGTNFDIEFRYAECGWEVGEASGGTGGFCAAGTVGTTCTPAQAGFDSAETPDTDYASLPNSRMNGIANSLCTGSNLTPPQAGVWRFAVRGGSIMCPNAGGVCATGMPGVCAQGALQCGITGATTCAPVTGPQPKQCNGLDNDCDGTIDEGPCPAGTTCDGTQCVSSCVEGGCPVGKSCVSGLCVESACQGVSCPAGQRCSGGHCVDPCSGIVCPLGQACRDGSCVDPCASLVCGMGQVCDQGACKPACPCGACATDETCVTAGTAAGHCVATACAGVSCASGKACKAGACVDPCTGAVCPAGETCKAGECTASKPADAGADSGFKLAIPGGADASSENEGGGAQAGMGDATVDDDASGNDAPWNPTTRAGCACTTSPGGAGERGAVLAFAAALAVTRRRRRR
jgi:MYXO-CTERM domain-containing protein